MLRIVLVFLAGVLVGANAVYYLMTRQRVEVPASSTPTVVEQPAVIENTAVRPATTAQPSVSAPASATLSSPVPAIPSPAGLIVPVQGMGVSQLSDTYTATRSEGRTHEAIDIMAPRGTPVLAVTDGTVEKLFESKQGGLTLYQFEPSGKLAYYYAHLDRYAAGVVEGKSLRQGEVIGYVGSTGNASPEGPHLHFAVFVLGPERQWWKGTAINPYPLLGGRS
jgi:murein DD-endopeptidase MepM/ murein hydrolase activator NlpD